MRHLLAGYDLSTDRLYRHVKPRKGRVEFLAFARYLRRLHPPQVRIAIVLDNFSPHLSTTTDTWVRDWAATNNVELAYVRTYASWLNRIEPHSPRCITRWHRPAQPRRTGPHDRGLPCRGSQQVIVATGLNRPSADCLAADIRDVINGPSLATRDEIRTTSTDR